MIKKILIYSLRFSVLALGIASLYLFNLFFMKPVSIDHYLGKELVMDLTDSPEELTYVGILDRYN